MSKTNQSILQCMFASFVKDAEPDEIQEAAKAVSDAENTAEPTPAPKEDTQNEGVILLCLFYIYNAWKKTYDFSNF